MSMRRLTQGMEGTHAADYRDVPFKWETLFDASRDSRVGWVRTYRHGGIGG